VSQQDYNNFPLIPINNIKNGKRFRKDLGNIAFFAKEIEKIGLLHPIVINQNRELICGLRRIEAFKALGRTEIPAHIVNMEDIVKGEISENVQRKDFSWEEIIEIKKAIEPEIRKEAEKRMHSGKPSAKFAEGTDNDNPISKNYSESQTRAKVAQYVCLHGKRISHNTLAKGERVYDLAQKHPGIFGQLWIDLNSEKISPHKAFRKAQTLQRRQVLLAEKEVPLSNDVDIIEGDFMEQNQQVADNSVDLIFTDPPYNLESLPLYNELGKVAARVLKDGGSLVTYCIQEKKHEIQDHIVSCGLTPI
jgi:ParB family transcriptional regulator, chromosome partitioning protein